MTTHQLICAWQKNKSTMLFIIAKDTCPVSLEVIFPVNPS